ncbi:hypothetical protein CYY_001349 [Polysphondylium violaceum]|uniref:V-SNARE family protein n=1 Tax=Polysphondylium violaceum TaxID=133409 RepID=A0A8J4Q090_9MYCE|nr:hypothetical protein CYY_001349 [Polysphondylium violaceum]
MYANYSNNSSSNVGSSGSSSSGGGSGLDDLYKQANKLLFSIRSDLEAIETGQDTSVIIQGRLSTNINQLARMIDQIDSMVSNEPVGKREIWRIKVKQLVDESKSLRKSMDIFLQSKYKKQLEDEEKKKLLGRRKQTDGSDMVNLMKENQHLRDSDFGLDQLSEVGNNIIYSLVGQNSKLKNVHKKIYDMANTLGLSRTIIQKIKRRQYQDKVIVYTGMVIVLIIIFVLWYFFR